MNEGSTINLEGNVASGGVQGYSAYEVAVQNGYQGTEEEWVNSFLTPDGYLQIRDVVDNVTSNYNNKPLSAKQGKNLKGLIDNNTTDIQALNNDIDTESNSRINNDANLQTQINALASGSPLSASSVDDMTDTSRIYVNTTDGYWYYYDGEEWIKAAVYQAEVNDSQVQTLNIEKINKFNNLERLKFGYEQGTMNGSTGEKGSVSDTRVRTIGRFHVLSNETLKIILPENTSISIYRYSAKTSGFISTSGFLTVSEYYINNEDVWIMLLFKNSDNSEISYEDVTDETFIYRYSTNDRELLWEKGTFSNLNNTESVNYDLRCITRYLLSKNITSIKVKNPSVYNVHLLTYENHEYSSYENISYKTSFSNFEHNDYDYRVVISKKDNTEVTLLEAAENVIFTYDESENDYIDVSVEFERMGLTDTGDLKDNLKNTEDSISEFYTKMRSKLFLNVVPSSPIVGTFENSITIFEYDENFKFVKYSSLTSTVPYILDIKTHYVKFMITFEDDETSISTFVQKFTIFNKEINFVKNVYYSTICRFVYGVNYPKGRDVDSNNVDDTITQYNSEIGYTAGLLKLPKNYTQEGTPTRMIIFCHSSGDYLNFTDTQFSTNYADYIDYLVDEGFAVYDSWAHSSFAPVTTNTPHNYGNPDNMACLTAGYKWCVENFNIATDGVFVASKSLGGQSAGNLCFSTSGIPVLAGGLLAPALSVLKRGVGYKPAERLENAWAFDMEGDYETILSTIGPGTSGANLPIEDDNYKNLIKQNADKFMAYTPMWNGLINANLNDLCEWSFNQGQGDGVKANWENLVRVCPTPIKIWVAIDDPTTPHSISYNFIKTLKNGGCLAELRSLPENTGGHHAVDTSADALKVDSINTRLGITHTNVPLAYVELVQWFRRFEI